MGVFGHEAPGRYKVVFRMATEMLRLRKTESKISKAVVRYI